MDNQHVSTQHPIILLVVLGAALATVPLLPIAVLALAVVAVAVLPLHAAVAVPLSEAL